jgi:hypothetical protein
MVSECIGDLASSDGRLGFEPTTRLVKCPRMLFGSRRRDNQPEAQKNAIAMARAERNALQNEQSRGHGTSRPCLTCPS